MAAERGVPSPQRFVDVLGPALRQAAAVARALEGRVENRPKSGQASVQKAALTIADSAAQEAILATLLEHFPDVCLAAVHAFPTEASARVVIDPIDGTLRSYLEARGPYATLIGLEIGGRYEAALVALPREGLFFDGVRGGEARRTRPGGPARPWTAQSTGERIVVSHELPEPLGSRAHHRRLIERLRRAGFEIWFGCGGAISVAPLLPGFCAGLRFNPRYDTISIRGRIGVLVTRAAGGFVWCEEGSPFPERLDAPARALLTAADKADRDRLLEALEPALRS